MVLASDESGPESEKSFQAWPCSHPIHAQNPPDRLTWPGGSTGIHRQKIQ